MTIRTDWNIPFDEIDASILLGGSMGRMLAKHNVRADWDQALLEIRTLIKPAAVWEAVPVREFRHDRLIMENGAVLTGGPIAEVMAGSEKLIVAICTVGADSTLAELEAKKNGSMMRAMFYEMLAGFAVGTIRQQMVDMFEKEIKAEGLHISTMLSPGESTWPVNQQTELFSVDTAPIGVTLTSTMMMNPMKSLSMVMGFGQNPLGSEGATNCDFCTMRDTCPTSQAGKRKLEPLAA